jgi:DNA-binding transcriptional ArsR family regulator
VVTYEAVVEALADGTRRDIVERLSAGELSVSRIAEALPVTRPAVSQHLAVLRAAGLVRDRREGTRRFYRLEPAGFEELRRYLERFWDGALASFAAAAEREEDGMQTHTQLDPVRRSVTVRTTAERAFAVFTDGIAAWWPMETHSIVVDDPEPGQEGQTPVAVVIEPRVGGRIYERLADGQELSWGTVRVWDPPRRLVLGWSPTRAERDPTEVEVTFFPEDDGTRVVLEHRNWEPMGPRAAEVRESYSGGWIATLARFAEVADREAGA